MRIIFDDSKDNQNTDKADGSEQEYYDSYYNNLQHKVFEKATPSDSTYRHSFANFRDKFVFVSGGSYTKLWFPQFKKKVNVTSDVLIYDVDADKWIQGPNLITKR